MSGLIRNKATESDIRAWLDRNGFYGQRAEFESVELFAIQRPGWKQLFRFVVEARVRPADEQPDVFDEKWGPSCAEKVKIWGAVLDEERKPDATKTQIKIFDGEAQLDSCLDDWSVDLISASSTRDQMANLKVLITFGSVVLVVLLLVALLKNL